jgi:IclR family pca regulon transcriptional regulator
MEEVRESGFAIVDQELEVGLRSIGVPIRDKGGAVLAGLSISVIEPQITREEMIKRYLRPLQNAAEEITSMLAS